MPAVFPMHLHHLSETIKHRKDDVLKKQKFIRNKLEKTSQIRWVT